MVFNKKIIKIGNSLAIVIPEAEVKINRLKAGEIIKVKLTKND